MSRYTRIAVAGLASVGAVFGYYKLDVAPKRAEATQLEQQVATKEAELAQTQALIQTYEGARAAYKDNYAKVVRLGKAIPSDDDTRSVVVQLDAAAKRSDVDFDTLNVNGASSADDSTGGQALAPGVINAGSYGAMPFALSFSGDFTRLGNFLARLDRFVSLKGEEIAVSGRLMRVESIQLVPGPKGWPGLNAQIGASSYVVPKTTAVTDTAATPGTTQAASTAPTDSSATTAATGTDLR